MTPTTAPTLDAPVYFAVVDPTSEAGHPRMTYWRQTNRGLRAWPAKARYGPRLLKSDVPAGLTGAGRSSWLINWANAHVVPFKAAVHAAIAADREGCAARFAAFAVRCVSCGRPLRDPKSKTAGIGPECEKYLPGSLLAVLAAAVAALHADLTDDLVGSEPPLPT